MKQVTQRLRDGRVEVLDVPRPEVSSTGVLVDVRASLISAGTERHKIETAQKGLVAKARARPDQVRQVVEKAKRDGIAETISTVRMRLDQPSALGYSASGVVVEVGRRVMDLAPGDRVGCAGGDYAVHAEIDHVPSNLCVRLPDGIDFASGAFATVGSIALHGVRQTGAALGERVAVIGLGLVGQLAGQILRAAGCRVLGIDLDESLVHRAQTVGAADETAVRPAVREEGTCDAVLIAAATPSSDPIELAASLCRDRGRVVVVGDVGMELPRQPYYEKEIDVRLSRSYGPGRYDPEYEERGLDYPIGYVRWTERRNMAAFLDLVASGRVDVLSLVGARYPVDQAPQAYRQLVETEHSPLAILLEYEPTVSQPPGPTEPGSQSTRAGLGISVIGAGSFASRVLIPGLARAGFELVSVASANGLSARTAADRFGFERAVTADEAIADPGAGVVAIATRHSSHARFATAALRAGKAVFVEKPPCITGEQLDDLRSAVGETGLPMAVGFNRRFATLGVELRKHLHAHAGPKQVLYRIKAEDLSPDHWVNDLEEGGGRLLAEGCHFIDFACWLVGDLPASVVCGMRPPPGKPLAAAARFSVVLSFADGSLATITYGTDGTRRVEKEYLEAHAGERSAILRDFRVLELYGDGRRRVRRLRRTDKGHDAQFADFRRRVEHHSAPLAPDQLATMGVTLDALRAAELGCSIVPNLSESPGTTQNVV